MSDQSNGGPQTHIKAISLNGGAYPNEDGTWRVVCWLSGIVNETEAANVSNWLAKLIQANIKPITPEAPPPSPPPAA